MLKFINDRQTILYDTNLHTQLNVEINNGVPYSKYCKQDDCAHVGFAIEVEQLFGRRSSGNEKTLDDIIAQVKTNILSSIPHSSVHMMYDGILIEADK